MPSWALASRAPGRQPRSGRRLKARQGLARLSDGQVVISQCVLVLCTERIEVRRAVEIDGGLQGITPEKAESKLVIALSEVAHSQRRDPESHKQQATDHPNGHGTPN